jgi:hypothetical protein
VEEITTIVVTKFHEASLLRELYALGVRGGRSRHQEAQARPRNSPISTWAGTSSDSSRAKKAKQVHRALGTFSIGHQTMKPSEAATARRSSVSCSSTSPMIQARECGCRPRANDRARACHSRTGTARRGGGSLRWARARPAFVRVREASARMQRRHPARASSQQECRATTARPSSRARHTFSWFLSRAPPDTRLI